MTKVLALDLNNHLIQGDLPMTETKTTAFDGSAGNGAVGTVPLFTVTGDVLMRIFGVCTESLAGASATISLGVSGNAVGMLPALTATTVAAGDLFLDAGSPVGTGTIPNVKVVGDGSDIIITVATANITDGTIRWICVWRPLSADADVTAA